MVYDRAQYEVTNTRWIVVGVKLVGSEISSGKVKLMFERMFSGGEYMMIGIHVVHSDIKTYFYDVQSL